MDGKKVVLVLVAVFFVFWMFSDPRGLASFADNAWAMTTDAFDGVIDFLGALGR